MPLRETLTNTWDHVQGFLFPHLRTEVGPLTPSHERLVIVLEVTKIDAHIPSRNGAPGRPQRDRRALVRAFVAKAVFNLPTTKALIDRLAVDGALRRLCGWQHAAQVPDESIFSRSFAEFAMSGVPARAHAALIKETHKDRIVGHISRDATAIEAREAPAKTFQLTPAARKRKRGRPKKGETVAPKEPRRLERQADMTLTDMLADLPTVCSYGAKRNAKGHSSSWVGYKLHIDTADGDIPVTCLLTSASVHDSQVAIPLSVITATRVTNLYDLMDSAYDAPEIRAKSLSLGHVPIIDPHTKRGGKADAEAEALARRRVRFVPAERIRFRERSAAERVNSAIKDSYGGRFVRVRGHAKVFCHLMLGVIALAAEQLMRLIT
jgi:Transposase DDE domain/Transposase domain (DUF772)